MLGRIRLSTWRRGAPDSRRRLVSKIRCSRVEICLAGQRAEYAPMNEALDGGLLLGETYGRPIVELVRGEGATGV